MREADLGGVTVDPLFVGVTRPAMAFGVTYAGLLVNALVTVELFLVTRNLLALLLFLPLHAALALLCLVEPRYFDLLLLWGRTGGAARVAGNARYWQASSYSPLPVAWPSARGHAVAEAWV